MRRRDRCPVALGANVLLQVEPGIEGHLDGVPEAARVQPTQHILSKKGAIHTKPHEAGRDHRRRQLVPQLPQKRQTGFPSWTLPERFFTRRMCVVSATCARIGE
jgi:hypothetical protein